MPSRKLLIGCFLAPWIALCLTELISTSQAQEEHSDRPNVILVLTDDQGWWDVGINGNPHISTPTMDQLAQESVRFTHFYAEPLCAPTRASLLTGRHYQRTGAVDTYMGRETMHDGETTVGQVFQRQGYRTALIGKWHLGRYLRYHPTRRGFDEFFGLPLALVTRYFDPDQLFENLQPVTTTGYITDVLTDQAIDFVRRSAKEPFFLYLAYNAPHSPYLAPDSYIEPYLKQGLPLRDSRIYGMITSIDDNLARLLEVVDELELKKNTIFILMGDNGGMSRYFRAGLRGEKGMVYEGGVRVPFIARWPNEFAAGAVLDAPGHVIDILPTLLALTGIPIPDKLEIDGKNLEPLLRSGEGNSPHDYIYNQWNHIRPVMDLPTTPIPLPSPPCRCPELATHPVMAGAVPYWAVQEVSSGFKLVRWTNRDGDDLRPQDALFHLGKDPGESRDVSSQYPDVADRLRKHFATWIADVTRGVAYTHVPIEIGNNEENPIEIELLSGEATGKGVSLKFDRYYRDRIEEWTGSDTGVRWSIDVVQAGIYELVLEYGSDLSDAGSDVLISVGDAEITHTVQATAGRNVFRPIRVGTLSLSRGPTTLEITPRSLVGKNLMTLHKISLRRIDSGPRDNRL